VAPKNPFSTKGLERVPSLKSQAAFTEAYCPYPQTSPRKTSSQGTFEPPRTPVLPALAVPGPSFSHSVSTTSEVLAPAIVEDRDEEIPDAPSPNSDPGSEPESEPSIIEDPFPIFPPPEPEPEPSDNNDSDSDDDMPKPIECKICTPPDFSGNRDKTTKFIRLITLYLDVNSKIYDTDTWKIAFALSFMKEGTAAAWMEDTITFAHELNPATNHPNGYGTWDQFLTHFEEAFNPIDSASTALHKLHALKQGNDLSEYIFTFKQLCNWAEIYSFNAQKDYFIRGLKLALLLKLCNSRDIPIEMEAMYKKIISIENAYQLLLSHRTLVSDSQNRSTDCQPKPCFTPCRNDPDAMDVDCLSEADKKAYMREGCCFKCGEKGHRANDPVKHPKDGDDDKKKKGKQTVRCTAPDDEDSSKIEELSDDEELDARRTDFWTGGLLQC
jgi:hypothetical protein